MDKRTEARITSELEEDLNEPEAWGEEIPKPSARKRLGSQVSIRLDEAMAERLREMARRLGVGYTALVRDLVIEGLRARTAPAVTSTYQVGLPPAPQFAGDAALGEAMISSRRAASRLVAS